MTELWQRSVSETQSLIAAGELSVTEVVDSVLLRVAETEQIVHAWAYVDERGARESANALDAAIRETGQVPPLAGAVLGVKDVIDVRGMPTVAGSASRAGLGPLATDARVVEALRKSGAIVLGKTETFEFAFGQGEPPTRNPRDPERYAGGSSIGSGVAVAVGSAHAALGTDTGGSIRNPAAVNGLVGLKPTRGLLDLTGLHTLSDTLDQIGPLTRTVADCELILRSMAGESVAKLHEFALTAGLAGVRIAVDRRAWPGWNVTDAVAEQTEQALKALVDLGAEIVDIHVPEWTLALPASLAIALTEAFSHHEVALRAHPAGYLAGTRVMLETGAFISPEEVELAHRARGILTDRLISILDEAGAVALASPTLPTIPPRLSDMDLALTSETTEDGLASALQMLTTANLAGMPALSVMGGRVGDHPIGLHLTARPFCEPALFSIAAAYERSISWSHEITLLR